MNLNSVRKKYLDFFAQRGHTVIASASLVPENDPTTLFTGSGMQPLVPYLLGQDHPQGTRLVNSQKSFRTDDIEEVGDNRHTTFFEMLGNWSLGDYFKKEQLPWVFDFLTNELKLDPKKIYVTVFAGYDDLGIAKDMEAVSIWKELFKQHGIDAKDIFIGSERNGYEVGMQEGRIFYYDAKNWWSRSGTPDKMPPGEPGGPDSEIFYDFGTPHNPEFGTHCHPNCDCGRFLEIGNSVFMEFKKTDTGAFEKLAKKNVDFGGGLERITAVCNEEQDVFKIDELFSIIKKIEELSGSLYADNLKSFRIITDHIRAATFLISAGVTPSNTDRGYFVRRLLRRAVIYGDSVKLPHNHLHQLADIVITQFGEHYSELISNQSLIKDSIIKEELKFRQTLDKGMKEFQKILSQNSDFISGEDAFSLFTTYGFPIELITEIAKQKKISVDVSDFKTKMEAHQEQSRSGATQKFKGGLASDSDIQKRYHTATHLLHAALRKVLGSHVFQKGSNITDERMRFDFSHSAKMTEEEKKGVEDLVNEWITQSIQVHQAMMDKEQAKKEGAIGVFEDKYGDTVSIYTVGDVSKEFCGGPHVTNTNEIGHFRITKEEAVSEGVRRIKATIQ